MKQLNSQFGISIMLLGVLLVSALPSGAQVGGDFELSWYTIDGGGITFSIGDPFKMGGTLGQPDAFGYPAHTGGAFELTGGFWYGATTGDVNGDGCVNDADLSQVLLDFGRSGALNSDVNDDGVVNDTDLSLVLLNFGRGC